MGYAKELNSKGEKKLNKKKKKETIAMINAKAYYRIQITTDRI